MEEKHVVSLDLAKRMKELGFKQESDFYWVNEDNYDWDLAHTGGYEWYGHPGYFDYPNKIAAYHLGELLEFLPTHHKMFDNTRPSLIKRHEQWRSTFISQLDGQVLRFVNDCDFWDIKPVSSVAKMLIYLTENNLIDPKSL